MINVDCMKGACGLVDREVDSRLKYLGVESHCSSCVEVLGKRLILYYLRLASSNWYLVNENFV